jgi:transposase
MQRRKRSRLLRLSVLDVAVLLIQEHRRVEWIAEKGFPRDMKCDSLTGPQVWGTAMGWRQGQSYSEDLRARVLAAVDGGMAARAAAKLFRVSVSYIYKALIRRRRTGEVSASPRRGHRLRKLTPAREAALAARIEAHPDLTLAALQAWLLAEHGGAAVEWGDVVGGGAAWAVV